MPNQLHKISYRKGSTFTLMIVGESGLGKTTFVNTLCTTAVLQPRNLDDRHEKVFDRTVRIEITKAVIEEKGFTVNLNIIDTPGFADYVNNQGSWEPIVRFIDDQHEAYLRQESMPNRQNVVDMRVHACLYFINPTGHSLKSLDIEVMKQISARTNLIPVIAKADSISPSHMLLFKDRIRESISHHQISVYACPLESDDEDTTKRNVEIMTAMPFSIIGSTLEVARPDGKRVYGRKYPWGLAEVENDAHCDFKKLRSLLIRTHMNDLISTTEEVHYENYRLNRLENSSAYSDNASMMRAREIFEKKIKDEEEKFRARLAEKVQVEEARFRSWEQKLIQERARLMKNLETEHSDLKNLMTEVDLLEKNAPSAEEEI